tara:strand:+ start:483 stop:1577 length:1095 start_codon:yes stop_codon:yes gene_type:complete
MKLPTLYKLDSKSQIREWSIETEKNCQGWIYKQTHGLRDGKLQTTSTRITEGKNIGKANETTVEKQCLAEATSLWTKQVDRKGYTQSVPVHKPYRPMLAQSYPKDKKNLLFPCFGQPKLDGVRCLARIRGGLVTLFSRQGKVFNSLPHIQDELKTYPDQVLDGELYIHGTDFQKLVGAIKRDKPSGESSLIQYHVYDIVNEHISFIDRWRQILKMKFNQTNFIKRVDTFAIQSESDIPKLHEEYTQLGYEGIMLRNQQGAYKINGRSKDLQKYKKFIDMEFEIIGAYENKGKQEGQCTLTCITKEGYEFGVKPKGNAKEREQYWTDYQAGKLKGKLLTVRFFSWTSSDEPVPRFPIGTIIRDYE